MSPVARTVHLWGVYALVAGAILVLVPDVLLGVLGIPSSDEPWIRVVGVAMLAVGVYYLAGARTEATVFFRGTVLGRLIVVVSVLILAAVWRYWGLIVLAVIEAASAAWTWTTLRRDERSPDAPAGAT